MNIDTKLNGIFNLSPALEGEFTSDMIKVEIPKGETLEYDSATIRNNLYELLVIGKDALESSLEIAKQSEAPRAFEVVSNMIKQLADVNMQIMDIHNKKQRLSKDDKEIVTNVTNNAIFCGTSKDLNEMINKLTKES